MAEEKKELSEEELKKAAGGRRLARAGEPGAGGTVVPNEPTDDGGNDSGPSVGDVTPIDDPAFQ